ncbi:GlsB/YeaQ/YmgE family stress response membrane protein [Propionimicrobium sp. PCR01-08-3]|uniref:GlsB/YeaQ/YmgE family stress response membrane protein n=1 Tax=Propionimicrobium sp. PCR01-08-3 TaxID=3052086 RepID=UPI00255D0B42|nr:GlsB/YeaQ/YmgE family stress response membrane protein [Propionimicrobium sp. PCR01-08-3]WIY83268.1 GlsB/YeaQ/YmgE family stress response membrane protein [Propionimicrobium sp. PCR01-08-3]
MMFISWLVLGLIAGSIARAVVGGGGGWLMTILLGILGAVVGGWISSAIFSVPLGQFWDLRTWIIAILGGFLVTFIYNKMTKKA